MTDREFKLEGKRVYVAGHRGMVGSAIVRRLAREGCESLTAARAELDLTVQAAVRRWFAANKPHAVFLAAARVGGIHANNTYRASFIYENLVIASNVIEAAHSSRVEKLMFLGSSCIYPRAAPQPLREDALLTGPLEPTNEPYAIAKIAGIKLAEAFRAIPRGQGPEQAECGRVGQRHAPTRVPLRRRPRRCMHLPDAPLLRHRPRQHRHR